MPAFKGIRRIALLHDEEDSYAAEIVRAALYRSFTSSQVESCVYGRFNAQVSCAVLVNPSDSSTAIIEGILGSGGKVVIFGRIGPKIAERLGVELRSEDLVQPDMALAPVDPLEPYNVSPAWVRYVGDHQVAKAAILPNRPLCRYDFADEWNNLGYGRILADGSPWSIAVTAKCAETTCLGVIEDRSARIVSAYATLLDTPDGAALWVNRSVGPVDSLEWGMIEFFVGEHRCSELVTLPFLREIPLGCSAAVTMRLDCDQAIASAQQLYELYASRGLPVSMAVATGLSMTSQDLALLLKIVESGGSVVSHSVNHHPEWGGSYEVALQEALGSREWIATHVRETRYAVSPFHQNPIPAVQALADAGYKGFVGGSIRDDPEFLMGRAGRVPFSQIAIISHSQQCMLHGDCFHRYGDAIDPYKECFALHVQAQAFFGYLDHPFSLEYQYGWASEAERLSAHEAFIDHMTACDGLWWCSLEQCLDFLVQRDSCRLWLDEEDAVRFTCNDQLTDLQPAAGWKGRILAPQ